MKEGEFWRRCLLFPCRHCKAEKAQPCTDRRGNKVKPHSHRQEEVRGEYWAWQRRKTAKCPTCNGTGRVKVVGPDATHTIR